MQSVNFYLAEYQPKPLSFDSRFASLVFVIFLIAFVTLGIYQSSRLTDLQQRLSAKQAQFAQLQADLAELQQKLAVASQQETLDAKIAARQQSLNSYRKILAKMKIPDAKESLKYSQILKQLAEREAQKVWLTRISIEKQNLSLQGRSSDSQAVPAYIDDLKNANALKRYFDELKVERDPDNEQLVNFSLLNGRLKQ